MSGKKASALRPEEHVPRVTLRRLWLDAGERPALPREYPYTLHVQRAELLDRLGEWDASEALCKRNADWCREAGLRGELAEAIIALCRIRRNRGRPAGQLKMLDEVLGISQSLGDEPGTIRAHVNLGLVHALEGRLADAAAEYRTAIQLAERSGLEQLSIAATGNLAQVLMLQGDYPAAIAANQRVIELCRARGDDHGLANAHCNLGNVYFYQGRYAEAMQCYQFQAGISHRSGDIHAYSVAVGNIGNIRYFTGDREGSMRCYREKLELSQRLGFATGIGQALGNIANVLLDEGDVDGAIDCDRQLMAIAEQSGDAELRASGCIDLGCLLQVKGDYPASLAMLDRAVEICRGAGVAYDLAMALAKRAESLLLQGDPAAAQRDAAEAGALAAKLGDRTITLEAALTAGRADPGRGREELPALLARTEEPEKRGDIHGALYQVTGDPAHRAAALELYRGLEPKTQTFLVRQKIEQLDQR